MRWRRLCSTRWMMLGVMVALIGLRVVLHWLLAPQTLPEHAYYGVDLERYTRQYLAAAHPPSEADRQVLAQLAQPVTLQFKDVALSDMLNDLAAAAHVRIETDWKSLEVYGVDEDSSGTIALTQVPAGAALTLTLDHLFIGRLTEMPVWKVQDGIVVVKRDGRQDHRVISKVHNASDLIESMILDRADWKQTRSRLEKQLFDIITTYIEPKEWRFDASITIVKGRVTVRGAVATQKRIEAFLNALRLIMGGEAFDGEVLGNTTLWRQAWSRLNEPLPLTRDVLPIGRIIQTIRDQAGVPVSIDWNSTLGTEESLELEYLTELPIANPSATVALDAAAQQTDFGEWALSDDGYVVVSAAEHSPVEPAVRLYDIRRIIDQIIEYYESAGSDDTGEPSLLRDLIDRFRFGQSRGSMSIFADADGEDRQVSTISQPVELIAQCIVASAGDELLLQSGSIDHIGGILVVRAPRRVHERIAEMLRQLDDAGGD